MSFRLNLVFGFVAIFSITAVTQNAEAQFFRNRNRNCPQQVRYVPPTCSANQYYVTAQGQVLARPLVQQPALQSPAVQPGLNIVNQPAAPVLNSPLPTAPVPPPTGIVESPVASPAVVIPPVIEPATQTLNPVPPVVTAQPELNTPATLEPVPTGDTQILPPADVPPAAEPPAAPAPIVQPPQGQPTPANPKSILEKGN